MAWEPVSTLPPGGRRALFTRLDANAGMATETTGTEGLIQAYGTLDAEGRFVLAQPIAGEPGDDWQPTHWLSE